MPKTMKLLKVTSDPFFVLPLTRGVAAGVEHISILNSLGVCRCIVDIGANRGQFSLAASRVFPD